jgi:hypothetical protein
LSQLSVGLGEAVQMGTFPASDLAGGLGDAATKLKDVPFRPKRLFY